MMESGLREKQREKWNKISFAPHALEKSAPEEPLILRASRLDPSSFPAGYQQNNNLIKELVTVEKQCGMRVKNCLKTCIILTSC